MIMLQKLKRSKVTAQALLVLGMTGFESIASAAPAPPTTYYVVCTCKNKDAAQGPILSNYVGIVPSSAGTGENFMTHSNSSYYTDAYLNMNQFIAGNQSGYSGNTGATNAAAAAANINKFSTVGNPAYNLDNAPVCRGLQQSIPVPTDPMNSMLQYQQNCGYDFSSSKTACRNAFANDPTLYISNVGGTNPGQLCRTTLGTHPDTLTIVNGYGGSCVVIEKSANDPCKGIATP
jgi:hypothetical protein